MRYRIYGKKEKVNGIAVELENGRFQIKLDNGNVKEVAPSTFTRWFKVIEELENKVSIRTDTQKEIDEIERKAKEAKEEAKQKELTERRRKAKQREEQKAAEPQLDLRGFTDGVDEVDLRNIVNNQDSPSITMTARFTEDLNSKVPGRVKNTDTFEFLGFNLVVVYSHIWSVDVRLFDTETDNLLYVSPTGALRPMLKMLNLDKEQMAHARKEIRVQRDAWSGL